MNLCPDDPQKEHFSNWAIFLLCYMHNAINFNRSWNIIFPYLLPGHFLNDLEVQDNVIISWSDKQFHQVMAHILQFQSYEIICSVSGKYPLNMTIFFSLKKITYGYQFCFFTHLTLFFLRSSKMSYFLFLTIYKIIY